MPIPQFHSAGTTSNWYDCTVLTHFAAPRAFGARMFPRWPHSRFLMAFTLGAGLARAEKIDFNREILPILSDACFRCHGPDAGTRKAKLRLDQREGLFRTREEITVVSPGHPENSDMILRITSKDEDDVMPPPDSNRPLKAAEIDLLKRWVASGAPWSQHWAYEPPQRPAVPKLGAAQLQPIDAFIRERLAREKLAPSPEASREALLRRITL